MYKDYKVYLRGFTPISELVSSVTKNRFGKKGTLQAQLYTHWSQIVGDDLAGKMLPNKIVFSRGETSHGTLYVDVYDAYAVQIAHMEGVIVEKLAVYYGYKIVTKIKIKQKPVVVELPVGQRQKNDFVVIKAGQPVQNVDDKDLKKVLENLSCSLANNVRDKK